MGGATFLYMFSGKNQPVIGKVELGRRKYRVSGLSFIVVVALALTTMAFVMRPATAPLFSVSNSDATKEVTEESAAALQDKTERLKNDILAENVASGDHGNVRLIRYRIKEGDTLSGVAARYHVNLQLIAASSGLKSPSSLKVGQELIIPEKPGLVYSMKKGDTVAAVAQRYSVKLEKIVSNNPQLPDLDMMEPGTTIFLPDARIPDPPNPWHVPAYGRITSGFGYRINPFTHRRHKHKGIDIGIYYSRVRASRDGVVIYAGFLGSYGKVVVIKHNSTYKTLYAHLSNIHVKSGQSVKTGKVIAISGNTGLSTGPHLHFEVIKNGVPVNPRRFVRF